MRHLIIAGMILMLAACNGATTKQNDRGEATVKEVHQAGVYTYLLVEKNKKDIWIAVPAMQAEVGETYYFEGGLEMKDFESKELERTFNSVLFVEGLSKTPLTGEPSMMDGSMMEETVHAGRVDVEKKEIEMEHTKGESTLADLFANKNDYTGKTIRVKGEVTKFNPSIMDRNWVHIQDGTEYEGQFDLTATTALEFEVGNIVTIEGTVSTDKDFGYGYVYDILLENAVLVQ